MAARTTIVRSGDGGGGGTPHPATRINRTQPGERGGHLKQADPNPSVQPGGGEGGGTPPNISVRTSHTACGSAEPTAGAQQGQVTAW